MLMTTAVVAGSNGSNTNIYTQPVHGFRLRDTGAAGAAAPATAKNDPMQKLEEKLQSLSLNLKAKQDELVKKVKERLHKEIETRVKAWLLKELKENKALAPLKKLVGEKNFDTVAPAIVGIVLKIVEKQGDSLIDKIAEKVDVDALMKKLDGVKDVEKVIENFINGALAKIFKEKLGALTDVLKEVKKQLEKVKNLEGLMPLLRAKIEGFLHDQIETRVKTQLRDLLKALLDKLLRNKNLKDLKDIVDNEDVRKLIVNAVANPIEKKADKAIEKVLKLVSERLNLKALNLEKLIALVAQVEKISETSGSIVDTVKEVLEKYLGDKLKAEVQEIVDKYGEKVWKCLGDCFCKLFSKCHSSKEDSEGEKKEEIMQALKLSAQKVKEE